jgi:hypothetical protein
MRSDYRKACLTGQQLANSNSKKLHAFSSRANCTDPATLANNNKKSECDHCNKTVYYASEEYERVAETYGTWKLL